MRCRSHNSHNVWVGFCPYDPRTREARTGSLCELPSLIRYSQSPHRAYSTVRYCTVHVQDHSSDLGSSFHVGVRDHRREWPSKRRSDDDKAHDKDDDKELHLICCLTLDARVEKLDRGYTEGLFPIRELIMREASAYLM
nr:hypothetical protein CFP56_59635 [Quercus suber]